VPIEVAFGPPSECATFKHLAFDPEGVTAISVRSTKEAFDPEGVAAESPACGLPVRLLTRNAGSIKE
jgi:hypothetical protein